MCDGRRGGNSVLPGHGSNFVRDLAGTLSSLTLNFKLFLLLIVRGLVDRIIPDASYWSSRHREQSIPQRVITCHRILANGT